jgi:predicted HTH transcriptional regulator
MALPVNIDDLVNHRKVEWARIEYKEGWNPEKVLHTLCAIERNGSPKPIIETNTSRDYFTFVLPVHKYFLQFDAETMRELNATDDPITVPVTDPVPYQYRTSTVPVTDPVKKLLVALRDGPCSPSDLRIAVGIKHRQTFRANYLNPALRNGLICAKDGISPHDPNIRYELTDLGRRLLQDVSSEADEGSHARNREEREVSDETNAPQNEVIKGGIKEEINCGLNGGIEKALLNIVVANPGRQVTFYQEALSVGRRTVERAIAALIADGKVEHRGSKKTGGYFTTKERK